MKSGMIKTKKDKTKKDTCAINHKHHIDVLSTLHANLHEILKMDKKNFQKYATREEKFISDFLRFCNSLILDHFTAINKIQFYNGL